jgi:hypothetical protein
MKKVATSIILACANLALLGLGYLDDWIDVYRHLPAAISILPLVIAFVVIPFLFLATVCFAIRDLSRAGSRWQAVFAFILSVPIGIIYSHPWF